MATETRRLWLVAALVAAMVALSQPGIRGVVVKEALAAIAVIDAGNLAQTTAMASESAKMAQEVAAQAAQVKQLLRSIGAVGQPETALKHLLDLGGAGRVLEDARRLEGIGSIGIEGLAPGTLVDVAAARTSIAEIVDAPEGASEVSRGRLEALRSELAARSAREALATSAVNREGASGAPQRLAALSEAAKQASAADGTLRDQVTVLTASMMFVVQELAELRGLLAVDLQREATGRLAAEPAMFASTQGDLGSVLDRAVGDAARRAGGQVFGR